MNTLALSYNHLPRHLKSCFLYFGVFPEDFEIDVRKLMWLWVAEGFVKPGTENVAKEYLKDLIERSLVIVDQKRSDGGVKVCRVHDLLHNLCLRKAKEEKFLHEIKPHAPHLASYPNTTIRRLFIHTDLLSYVFSKPSSPSTRSFLYFTSGPGYFLTRKVPSLFRSFKHIRVLELDSYSTMFFPNEIGNLVQLRYLSIKTRGRLIPKSISTLLNLQTLVVYGATQIDFPFCKDSNMTNLMHMCIKPSVKSPYPVALQKIQTISMLHLPVGRQPVLERAPNLRYLGCVVSLQEDGSVYFPPLDILVHLEELKIYIYNDYHNVYPRQARFTCLNRLPHNLRKVTFVNCYLPWTDLSQLGILPNLEILKILRSEFQGPRWDTNDGEFQSLKYLKIESRELAELNISSDHFPRLERLIMNCRWLEEIPMCLGDIPTMVLIELISPTTSAADSARLILEEQQSLGNDGLKLIINDNGKDGSDIQFKYSDSSEDEVSFEELLDDYS